MKFSFGPHFDKSLDQLYEKGQLFSSVTKKVRKCIRLAEEGKSYLKITRGLNPTKHGENRIKNCRKFDVGRGCRLIFQVENQFIIFLYVGLHKDCDKWLDSNRGIRIAIDTTNNNRLITIIEPSAETESRPKVEVFPYQDRNMPLLDRFQNKIDMNFLFKEFNWAEQTKVRDLNTSSTDEDILNAIALPHLANEKRDAISNILFLSRDTRKSKDIENTLKYHMGKILPLDQVDETTLNDSLSRGSDQIFELKSDSDLNNRLDLMRDGNYQKWMLYMHPDQIKLAEGDFEGTARLKGVSGSGKTAVIINRALNLSKLYKNEKILILTLNKPLTININKIIGGFNRTNIEVKSLWSCFEELIIDFIDENNPNFHLLKRSYGELTERNKESPEDIWEEFFHNQNNNEDAWNTMQNVHQYLLTRGIFPKEYIKEEFDYIRSHFSKKDRDKYLEMPREGRAIPLNSDNRIDLLKGLKKWESKMLAVGLIDYAGLASELYVHVNEIKHGYRCILVDEEQDFGSLELAIIRKLAKKEKNDLFLAGDSTQRVYTKRHDLVTAEVKIAQEFEIKKNYRNSKEVLEAAYAVLVEKLTDPSQNHENVDDEIILEPEYAESFGYKPLLCRAESIDDEFTYGFQYIKENLLKNPGQYGCLAVAGIHINHLTDLHRLLRTTGFPDLQLLNGDASFDNKTNIYLSDLEQTKGFEFDVVVIVGCSQGRMPNPYLPQEEDHRDLSRLYVAMTRAKTNLVVSFSGQKSSFLEFTDINNYFNYQEWNNLEIDITAKGVIRVESPNKMGYLEPHQAEKKALSELNARELLLTKEAIGMKRRRQNRLLQHITGKKTTTSGPVTDRTWSNLQSLFQEDRVIINRILGGNRLGEEMLNEVSWYENTFNISKIDNKTEIKMLGDTKVRDKYTIKNEPSREWRVHTIGKCRLCGRPAYQGDNICFACSSD